MPKLDERTKSLLDIYNKADEGLEALAFCWPSLEACINSELLEKIDEGYKALEEIMRFVQHALGGSDRTAPLQYEQENES